MIRKLNKFVFLFSANCCLQSASTTSSLLPGAGAGKSSKSGLRSGAGGLGAVSSGGTKLDVQGGDAERLNFLSDILGSQHSSVRGCLLPVSLHLHAASNSGDGFTARQVGDVDESVVERGEDVKKKAKIPQNAKWFCWLYPIALNDDIFKENSGAKLGDSECTLLTVGGYVYFDKDKKVVQVNTLVPGNTGLFFGPPKKFDKNWIPDLQKEGRFHQITIKPLRDAGARHFCWIRPNEPIVEYVSQNVTKKKILCPFGGFAYLFNDNPYQHDERNRYFEILGKEQYQQEFAKLQKANASASVPKSKRFALVGEKLATLAKLQRELSAARKKKSEAGSGLSPQKAASWTKEQVQTWLKENQFEKYAQSFFEEDVDGEILLGIEEADLDGMKVSRMHRKKLMRLVNELKKDGEVSAADAEKAAAASATEKAIKEMELQIFRLKSELQDTRVCNCCYTNKKCAFQPCGHLFACTDCAKELVRKPCPLCRRRVTSYIAVYI